MFDFNCTHHRRGDFQAIGTITSTRGRIATFVDFDGGGIASGNRGGEFFTIKLIGIGIGNFTVKNIGKFADCFGIANQNISITGASGVVFGFIGGTTAPCQDFDVSPCRVRRSISLRHRGAANRNPPPPILTVSTTTKLGFVTIKKPLIRIKRRPNSIATIDDIATATIYPDCHTILIDCW